LFPYSQLVNSKSKFSDFEAEFLAKVSKLPIDLARVQAIASTIVKDKAIFKILELEDQQSSILLLQQDCIRSHTHKEPRMD